jgi:hypothetical protein
MNLKKLAVWTAKQPLFALFLRVSRYFHMLNPLPVARQGVV